MNTYKVYQSNTEVTVYFVHAESEQEASDKVGAGTESPSNIETMECFIDNVVLMEESGCIYNHDHEANSKDCVFHN